jgi:hypothetical protein
MSVLSSWASRGWALLTDVPGEPAASGARRLGRALPLVLPLAALLALAGWKWGWEEPRFRAERAAGRPLVALADEVAALRLHRSPGEAPEAENARALRQALPHGLAGLPAVLAGWGAQAAARGWKADFGTPVAQPGASAGPLALVSVRAGLEPVPGNLHSWSSLMGLLGAFSAPESRIEVSRLVIRADEQGRYSVETRLSTPYLAEIQEYAK